MTSIRPQNPETLRNIYSDSNIKAGDIVIIEQPIGVFIKCEEAVPGFEEIFMVQCDLTKTLTNDRRSKTFKSILNEIKLNIYIKSPGYQCTLGGTDYSVQGYTLPKVIIDLNKDPNYTRMSLNDFIVCFTRTKNSKNCRIMPFNYNSGIEHLLKLEHADIYILGSVL